MADGFEVAKVAATHAHTILKADAVLLDLVISDDAHVLADTGDVGPVADDFGVAEDAVVLVFAVLKVDAISDDAHVLVDVGDVGLEADDFEVVEDACIRSAQSRCRAT